MFSDHGTLHRTHSIINIRSRLCIERYKLGPSLRYTLTQQSLAMKHTALELDYIYIIFLALSNFQFKILVDQKISGLNL